MHPLLLIAAAGGIAYLAKRTLLPNSDATRTTATNRGADVRTSSSQAANPGYGERTEAESDPWSTTPSTDSAAGKP